MPNAVKDAFERARSRVLEMQRAGVSASEIVQVHSDEVDLVVIELFADALERSGHDPAGIALVALGGYGRSELAPNSDLDLMLLYRGWAVSDVNSLNREVIYPLWDSGRELGDRVREPGDVVKNLDRIDEACAALDVRLLAGDRGLFADMQTAVWRRFERSRASYVTDLVTASADRHGRYGHGGHLLEPNIRDSAGGLRDIHTLGWASKVFPGGEGLDGLVSSGRLSRIDADLIDEARSFLLRLRIELHLATDRHSDQLYLAEQDDIAVLLGYEATGERPAADRLMQELFRHARHVDAVVESFWDRASHQLRKRRWRTPASENVGDGCVLISDSLEVVATTNVADDPAGWLRVFRRSILRDAHIGRSTLNRLSEEVTVAGTLTWSLEAREVFIDIIESGTPAVRALEAMDLTGFLVALFPEWEAIRAYPQRDLYHRYSVDRHLFAAIAELASSRNLEDRDLHDAWSLVGDPDGLFFATFMHDVGKGRGGDHSKLGAKIAVEAARAMGMTEDRSADVEFLVHDHLMLAETAMRRDLNDDKTIEETAARITDPRRLAMLYLLTRADSLATGPEAWSSFRASLVRELYGRTREFLAGVPSTEAGSASQRLAELAAALDVQLAEAARLIGPMPESWLTGLDISSARRQLELIRTPLVLGEVRTAVHHGDDAQEFLVAAPDRPGLFSTVAGILALRGFDVHDAEIYTRSDGVAFEVFRVMSAHAPAGDERWTRLRDDIASALEGSLDIDAALAKKAAETRHRRGVHRHDTPSRVLVDNSASDTHTVVEVHTSDRLGLLRLITKSLTASGCDLSLAKVATYGLEVVDVFYVRDLDGRKIFDPDDVTRIEEGLLAALQAEIVNA